MTADEILSIFFVECEESLAAAEAGLAACREGTQDADTVNAIFRAVHSVKGGAGAFGFAALQGFTHTFETLLSDVREGSVAIDPPLVELLLRALDTLSDHVNAARDGGELPDDAALLARLEAAQAANAGSSGNGAGNEAGTGAAPAPAEAQAGDPAPTDDPFDLGSLLDDIAGDIEPATTAADPVWALHVRPHAAAMRNGSEPLLMLRELAAVGGECLSCDAAALPPLEGLDCAQGYLGWTFALPGSVSEAAVRDIFDFVGDDVGLAFGADAAMPPLTLDLPRAAESPAEDRADSAPQSAGAAPAPQTTTPAASPVPPAPPAPQAAAASAPAAAGQSIRIDLAKLDRLIDTVGELVIAQAMLAQRLSGERVSTSDELAMIEGLTRGIQESAMSIRAQPIGSVFSRVPRILRELASTTGKHVRLELSGEATELDKTVIERLGEPLTHLIRNAVDHGIETAEERLAAGKPADGTLTLSAEHRANRILIRIADDGRGIDRARVFAKAVEKGIVAADAPLSREEIDALIFAPGFSTAQSVSNISGRGVGMDVVRQNVKDLGGRITIESVEGRGATFTLTLPLTLAISDGMIVNVGDQVLVVPLAHVVESLRPGPGEVQGLGTDRAMLNVRGRFLPVLPLHRMVGAGGEPVAPEQGVLIVVDTEAAGKAALLVDAICDQRQFVIKSLDTHFRQVEGVAGATILGDGRVALIVDVDGLVARAVATGTPSGALAEQVREAA
jgi:two-component system chemotaxis sensor kinase CheA